MNDVEAGPKKATASDRAQRNQENDLKRKYREHRNGYKTEPAGRPCVSDDYKFQKKGVKHARKKCDRDRQDYSE